jgi:hypothetical protein
MLLTATINGVLKFAHITEPRTFADGDVLDVPDKPNVIHAPRYTPGEVALHLPDRLASMIKGCTGELAVGEPGPATMWKTESPQTETCNPSSPILAWKPSGVFVASS